MEMKKIIKVAIVTLSLVLIFSAYGCKGKNKKQSNAETISVTEATTKKDDSGSSISVTIKDDFGNETTVSGELIIDESGNKEVIITDNDGNRTVIKEADISEITETGSITVSSEQVSDIEKDNRNDNENETTETKETKSTTDTNENKVNGDSSSEKDNNNHHSHSWEERVTQIYHPEESHYEDVSEQVWVVDKAAWREPIWTRYYLCSCGEKFYDAKIMSEHAKSNILAGIYTCGSNSGHSEITGYTDHPEEGHYETKTTSIKVVDKEAFYENKSNYYCSVCGATK